MQPAFEQYDFLKAVKKIDMFTGTITGVRNYSDMEPEALHNA